jgi:hypothetical protein
VTSFPVWSNGQNIGRVTFSMRISSETVHSTTKFTIDGLKAVKRACHSQSESPIEFSVRVQIQPEPGHSVM